MWFCAVNFRAKYCTRLIIRLFRLQVPYTCILSLQSLIIPENVCRNADTLWESIIKLYYLPFRGGSPAKTVWESCTSSIDAVTHWTLTDWLLTCNAMLCIFYFIYLQVSLVKFTVTCVVHLLVAAGLTGLYIAINFIFIYTSKNMAPWPIKFAQWKISPAYTYFDLLSIISKSGPIVPFFLENRGYTSFFNQNRENFNFLW